MIYENLLNVIYESDKEIVNIDSLKSTVESFYYRLSDQITSENNTFRKILESVEVLKNNNVFTEADESPADKTLLDKLIIIFRKACLLFSKVKNEAYKKFIEVAYKKVDEQRNRILNTVHNDANDPRLQDVMTIDYYWISDASIDSYNAYIRATNELGNQLNDAYDNSDIEKANQVDFSKLPEFKFELDKESVNDTIGNLGPNIYRSVRGRLDDAKKNIEDNLSSIEHMQELLSRKLKIKEINHNQMRIASKQIEQFNYQTKAVYKYINTSIKIAFLLDRTLQKIEAKLK